MSAQTIVLYDNGQYNPSLFNQNVTITTDSPTYTTSPNISFESDHIHTFCSATSKWYARSGFYVWDDVIIPEGAEVWVDATVIQVNRANSGGGLVDTVGGIPLYIKGTTKRATVQVNGRDSTTGKFRLVTYLENNGDTTVDIHKIYYTITSPWEAVTNITGNGKTYTLAKIESANINDGAPVTGASASAFEVFTNGSLVSKMIEDVIPSTEGKVIVRYTIPSATYSYIKLVYKKDSIPTTYSDGTAVDILQSSTYAEIADFETGTYYFVIFTDKSTSEPKEFTIDAPAYQEIKMEDAVKSLDMTHYVGTSGYQISELSQYYLTDYILVEGAISTTLTYGNRIFGVSDMGIIAFYPVTRLRNVTKFTFEVAKQFYSYKGWIALFKVVNGEMVEVAGIEPTVTMYFTEYTISVDHDTVDYIVFYGGGGHGYECQLKNAVITIGDEPEE